MYSWILFLNLLLQSFKVDSLIMASIDLWLLPRIGGCPTGVGPSQTLLRATCCLFLFCTPCPSATDLCIHLRK